VSRKKLDFLVRDRQIKLKNGLLNFEIESFVIECRMEKGGRKRIS